MPEQNQVVTFKSDGIVGGEQSLREILVALNASAGTGPASEVRAGTPVFDSNGKLVRVEIVPPAAANATQIAEALQNAGVAQVQTCFPQLVLSDLNVVAGIAIGGGFPALAADHQITVFASVTLGVLRSTGYTNFPPQLSAFPIIIAVSNRGLFGAGGTDIVIPINATITLDHAGGPSVYTFTKALTIKPSDFGSVTYDFYGDDQGNLFVRFGENADGSGIPVVEFPFESDYLVACQDPLRAF